VEVLLLGVDLELEVGLADLELEVELAVEEGLQ